MNTTPSHRRNIGDLGILLRGPSAATRSIPETAIHPQTAVVLASMAFNQFTVLTKHRVIVIGGGIAGLTAAALLAQDGIAVTLLEAHHQAGGCAGTFRRGPWIFDVGATQVAGLEPGGSHARILQHLGISSAQSKPARIQAVLSTWATVHHPSVFGTTQSDGPKNGLASSLAASDFGSSASFYTPVTGHSPGVIQWSHQDRGGISAPCSQPYVLRRWPQGLFTTFSIANLLQLCGCQNDKRLRRFLDLQLKLYSQEPADRTAALYGATVLQMAQAPLGLWHLQGSMQVLSEQLSQAIETAGGEIRLRHRVQASASFTSRLDRYDNRDRGWCAIAGMACQ